MNYLVDTCILSELAKRRPNAKVAKWLSGHSSSSQFFVSAVTVGEIMEGIESLPPEDPARRKLSTWFRERILDVYKESILPLDRDVAVKWGEIKGMTNRMCKARPDLDTQIAATALVHGLTIVTRNVADMEYTGARTVNPFGDGV